MSFEFTNRPQADQYVDTINTREQGPDMFPLPHFTVITKERAFWRNVVAGNTPESQLGSIAVRMAEHLSSIREGYRLVVAAQQRTLIGNYATLLADWYSDAAVILPHSQLLREPDIFPHIAHEEAPSEDGREHILFIDYMHDELNKTGLHIAAADTEDYRLPAIENGQERWLEGGTLFLRARRPAEPTAELLRMYRDHYGRRLDRSAFISFSPRMKLATWMGDDA